MALGRLWAGKICGTNIGNVFAELIGTDAALTGVIHINDFNTGIVIYRIQGQFNEGKLHISGITDTKIDGASFGDLTAVAHLNTRGELTGQWSTSIGSRGTFTLFPHDPAQAPETAAGKIREQLHTTRHQFGAIELNREQLTNIADEIQRDFMRSTVIVTVVTDTEQALSLEDFKTSHFNASRAAVIILFAQESEASGLNRVVRVEFGPQVNIAMVQGGDEAWVLGMREKLKHSIRPFERNYVTNTKFLGGFKFITFAYAVVILPSFASFIYRSIFMISVLIFVFSIEWLHKRYLPLAVLHLRKRQAGFIAQFAPSAISWISTIIAGAIVMLLQLYLEGKLPTLTIP